MKILSLFLTLPLLLSPALVQASDKLTEQDIYGLWVLKQNGELFKDIHGVVAHNLIALEQHGVWLPAGTGKEWVSVEKIVSDLTTFRDDESSEAAIAAVLEIKEPIKEGLLKKLAAQWEGGLEDLVDKKQKQENGSWHAGKAYGAAFRAHLIVEISAAYNAATNAATHAATHAAYSAATNAARNAAWYAAYSAARNAATHAAYTGSWRASYNAIYIAVRSSAEQKLKVLASRTSDEMGPISYNLSELFTLLWLTENAQEHMKKAFDAPYEKFPEMELDEVKAVIWAEVNQSELKDNMFINALKRDLDAVEKFVLAK